MLPHMAGIGGGSRRVRSGAVAESSYDCIVIGSGPGGYVAAIRAAQLGMKTAVVEKGNVGGRCLNEACIPAKAFLRVAEVIDEVNHAKDFGISVNGATFDFGGAVKHRDKVVKTLTGGVSMLFDKNKIELIEGLGALTEEGNVRIGASKDGTEYEAGAVVLACGSVPKPLLDLKFGDRVLDTAGTWLLGEQPKRLCVIGAGASGTEVASAYGRLGTEVVLLEALDQILPLEDDDIAKACAREIGQAEREDRDRRQRGGRRGRQVVGQGDLRRRDRGVRLPVHRRRPRAGRGGPRPR